AGDVVAAFVLQLHPHVDGAGFQPVVVGCGADVPGGDPHPADVGDVVTGGDRVRSAERRDQTDVAAGPPVGGGVVAGATRSLPGDDAVRIVRVGDTVVHGEPDTRQLQARVVDGAVHGVAVHGAAAVHRLTFGGFDDDDRSVHVVVAQRHVRRFGGERRPFLPAFRAQFAVGVDERPGVVGGVRRRPHRGDLPHRAAVVGVGVEVFDPALPDGLVVGVHVHLGEVPHVLWGEPQRAGEREGAVGEPARHDA